VVARVGHPSATVVTISSATKTEMKSPLLHFLPSGFLRFSIPLPALPAIIPLLRKWNRFSLLSSGVSDARLEKTRDRMYCSAAAAASFACLGTGVANTECYAKVAVMAAHKIGWVELSQQWKPQDGMCSGARLGALNLQSWACNPDLQHNLEAGGGKNLAGVYRVAVAALDCCRRGWIVAAQLRRTSGIAPAMRAPRHRPQSQPVPNFWSNGGSGSATVLVPDELESSGD